MTPKQKKFVLAGIGVLVIAGTIYWFQRRRGGLGKVRQILDRHPEAPAIDGASADGMKTTLRASPDMPIDERVASIQQLIYQGVIDPGMRKVALQVTSKCAERDDMCELEAIFDFTKKHVRYSGDVGEIKLPDGSVQGIDLYQTGRRTLEMGAGDCDDQTILNATLAALNGFTPKLRVMNEQVGEEPSHIYGGALYPKNGGRKFIALDTTLPGRRFNVEPPSAEIREYDA